jgi:cellulose synthase/poly-beta-1,6-N-acetylglucosamine synthase-like glycosyltransferase
VAAEPEVTVVVAVKDRRVEVLRCLDAIAAQDGPSFEVLVIDNGSADGTLEALGDRATRGDMTMRVAQAEGRIGRVRNEGARLARGEIVAFTDSDCIPAPGWLAAGVEPFEQPAVGVVTGTTLPEHPPPYDHWYASMTITEQTWRFETCNAFFRREALLRSDGFMEGVDTWEDTAAGWALLSAGWQARFAPDAMVHHDVTYPGFLWHLRRVQNYGQAAALVARYPGLRRTPVFWHRYFLRARDAEFAAALAGLALAPWRRWALVAALPYVRHRLPGLRLSRGALVGVAQMVLYDAAVFAGMVRGSLRWRRLLL